MKLSERFDWLEDVQRIMGGDTAALGVALALLRRQNRKTGQCNPSYETIARDCGFDHRDRARRAIKRLRKNGLIEYRETYGGDRQNTNQFTLTRCTGAPGAVAHPVQTPPLYPVHQCTTEPVGNTEHTGAPLEAAPGAQRKYFEAPPKAEPTDEEKALARKHTADLLRKLKEQSARQGEP